MSYVPDVENDVFISYTHIDNEPLSEGQRGWISEFHHSLQVRLKQLLGEELAIWRDAKLSGNDYFDSTLIQKLRKTAILVSILSPRYLRSGYCLKELTEFSHAWEQLGAVRLADQARVFKIVKTHVPREQHPPELQELLGYEFYRIDEATGRPREFLLDASQEALRQYWAKLEDLAFDIHNLLKTLRYGRTSVQPGASVFLAETTSDVQAERDSIKRELQDRGYGVLPAHPLPLQAAQLEAVVRSDLARCRASVHIIGRNYGVVPEADAGDTRSIIQLQNDLAADHAAVQDFARVIWIPEGLHTNDPRQQQYLDALRKASHATNKVELLESTIEELKAVLQTKLTETLKHQNRAAGRRGPSRIYVICDTSDLDAVRPLEDWLYEQQCEVLLSAVEGDETQVREYHQDNLVTCDRAIIFYGATNELWVRAKLRDLEKAYGYGRLQSRDLPAAIYIAPPETPQKQRFRTLEVQHVIKAFDAFSPDLLKPFVES